MAWFRQHLDRIAACEFPRDLEPHLPGILWFFQMGVIFFWVIDESPIKHAVTRLLSLAAKSVTSLIRVSALPLMRPVRKAALELVEIVQGAEL